MCSHYQAVKERQRMERYFAARGMPLPAPDDLWPRRLGEFVRRPPEHDAGDEAVPEREAVPGRWGLVSGMTRAEGLAKAEKLSTFNARSETAATSFTFGNAWRRGQRCIIPAEAVYEPDWRTGTHIPTRFTRADGAPLGVAGLWDRYRNAAGDLVESYTMLMIDATNHALFRDYHQVGKEKRMVVILPDGAYEDWLTAPVERTREFLLPYPAEALVATPVPKEEAPA
jgi:putative SOS response-associated peptidase YedK